MVQFCCISKLEEIAAGLFLLRLVEYCSYIHTDNCSEMYLHNYIPPFSSGMNSYNMPFLVFTAMLSDQSSLHENYDSEKNVWCCPNGCLRKYSTKGNLNRHITYECGVHRKFTCEICQKSFALKSNCKTHMGTVHKIII